MPKKRSVKRKNTDQEEGPQEEQHVEEEQQQSTNEKQQLSRKITQIINGQQKEYHYVTTVKSLDELDKFRFKNHCQFIGSALTSKRNLDFKSLIMPCTRKRKRAGTAELCIFELKAWRPTLESGEIHIYSFSQHNHPLKSEAKRSQYRKEKDLMADEKPPVIFCTPDNVEWTFLETFPDYDTFDKFRLKNNFMCRGGANDKSSRIRCYCMRKCNDDKCKVMLSAVKTTKQFYHVYKCGEHDHPVIKQKRKQKSARGKQKSRQEQMEDADEEGEVPMEEVKQIEGGQHTEDIAQPAEQDEQMETDTEEYPLETCQRRLESNLKRKIRKMLDQRRLEMEAQEIVQEETSSDDEK